MKYHPDEIRIQERAGVRHIADRKSDIYSSIPLVAQSFLEAQPYFIMGAAQENGSVWATAIFDNPGFVQVMDARTLQIHAFPISNDPMYECITEGNHLGTIGIDFSTRRRMRTNGIVRKKETDGFVLEVHQVYSNCPKYIQAREIIKSNEPSGDRRGFALSSLTEDVLRWIHHADTFFIASHHPDFGADVSHRGGMPGFVQAEDDHTIVFPDYKGNSMFNTLGNFLSHPQGGLLFLDFETGDLLQISGTVEIDWGTSSRNRFAGAERILRFHVEQAWLTLNGMPLTWRLPDYSPANPLPTKSGSV
ncbi:pyridoxamine 5'-phosphate oxidase family protein [Paenibacillus nasutitermitis]|uniref:Pyridoxamine 5'-phosphate oxidase N-terminal domain-containing protein n=1 Tax=Paenibacillus nasutitermitis TaxID=1652958 RepID=A0A917DMZ5_9BACL|nr:pyridoxamine 5'-phosphate oxidase family protein [Paenibacillus nasutitermitis]GGD50580.1 hypothetical protein GCM10010911_05140 [Paenibacillus nasutitermitis]